MTLSEISYQGSKSRFMKVLKPLIENNLDDLNAAINILKRYEQNHLALLTAPLDVSSVVNKYNLLINTCS